MSNPPKRRWHVTAIEWLSHRAIVEADTEDEARAQAQRLWSENAEHEAFRFSDAGLDGFHIEEA
jgi:hypothetical protein